MKKWNFVFTKCLVPLLLVDTSAFLQPPPHAVVTDGSRINGLIKSPIRRNTCNSPTLGPCLWMTTNGKGSFQNSSSDEVQSTAELTAGELLAELDRRNIRYRPTATLKELEQLLINDDGSNSSNNKSSETDIALIVAELLARGVRLPPHASRTALERLLQKHRHISKKTAAKKPMGSPPKRRQHKSIPRLLNELDELGIRYPPGASPAVLERLLRTYQEESSTSPSPPRRPPVYRQSPHRESTSKSRPRNGSRQSSITSEILAELNQRGIRFPPSATRAELEELLLDHKQSSRGGRAETTAEDQHISNRKTGRSDSKSIDIDGSIDESLTESRGKSAPSSIRSEDYKVTTGDKRPRTTSKVEVPVESVLNSRAARDAQCPSRFQETRPRRKMKTKRSTWSKLYNKSRDTVTNSIFQAIPDYVAKTRDSATKRLSKAAERAARKARHATRSAKDFFAEDDYGIRDVEYSYVSKDIPIDVPAEPIEVDDIYKTKRAAAAAKSRRHSTDDSFRANHQSTFRAQSYTQTTRRRPSRGQQSATSMRNNPPGPTATRTRGDAGGSVDPASVSASSSSLFRLPPAKTEKGSFTKQSPKTRKARYSGSHSDRRRIYSPYSEDDLPSQAYRDSIDRLGKFVGNATESILWGHFDGKHQSDTVTATGSKSRSKRKHNKARSGEPFEEDRGVTWKDRLEERLDSLLGIHEEGDYYNRWAQQDVIDKENEGGNNAFSVAQGLAKSRRRHGRRNFDRPFWEQENLISSLFGKTPPAGYQRVGVGNLLPFMKTLVKSSLLLASNACDWASVRGSLPQPVVVVGVTSCVLSARPGKRILTMAIALVAFRIFGEFIHEGLYGGEDWEEHHDEKPDGENDFDGVEG